MQQRQPQGLGLSTRVLSGHISVRTRALWWGAGGGGGGGGGVSKKLSLLVMMQQDCMPDQSRKPPNAISR